MALLSYLVASSIQFYIVAAVILFAAYFIRTAYSPGLRSLLGPFPAKFTDLWRLRKVLAGDFEQTTIHLHNEYGDIVRTGPNTISIANPAAIESIYGLKETFPRQAPCAPPVFYKDCPSNFSRRANFTMPSSR